MAAGALVPGDAAGVEEHGGPTASVDLGAKLQRAVEPDPGIMPDMKVFLCASRTNYGRVRAVKEDLEHRGHIVTLPNNYDDPGQEERVRSSPHTDYRTWKASMLRLQTAKVQANDAVLVLNFDKGESRNYLGGATFLEVFKAWELGRKIYFFNPLPDGPLRDELEAMRPSVIDSDLDQLT